MHGDSRPTAGCCRLWSTGLQRDAIFRTGTEAFGLPFLFAASLACCRRLSLTAMNFVEFALNEKRKKVEKNPLRRFLFSLTKIEERTRLQLHRQISPRLGLSIDAESIWFTKATFPFSSHSCQRCSRLVLLLGGSTSNNISQITPQETESLHWRPQS